MWISSETSKEWGVWAEVMTVASHTQQPQTEGIPSCHQIAIEVDAELFLKLHPIHTLQTACVGRTLGLSQLRIIV